MRPLVEVCLVSFDSGSEILAAIDSVLQHLPDAAFAIQENSTSSRTLDALDAHDSLVGRPVRVVHDSSNPGFGAACNALAAESEADWLLFLNPDATLDAWPFAADPPSGYIFGPAVVHATRPDSHRGVTYSVVDELRRSWLRQWGPAPSGAGFVSGAALLISRHDFVALGGFDDRFFLYYEDIDLCLRANAAEIFTEVVEGFAISHSGAHSTTEYFDQSLLWSYESGSRFHDLHGHSVPGFRMYVAADSFARWCLHGITGDSVRRRGYASLLRKSVVDLVRRNST